MLQEGDDSKPMACFWTRQGGSEGEIKDGSLRKGIIRESYLPYFHCPSLTVKCLDFVQISDV